VRMATNARDLMIHAPAAAPGLWWRWHSGTAGVRAWRWRRG
jgi:hypothetical protein